MDPASLRRSALGAGSRALNEARAVEQIFRTGLLRPQRPDKALAMGRAVVRYGPIGGGATIAAIRSPTRPAIFDELGSLSFAEVEGRSNALANELSRLGVGAGSGIGVLCRNHRGFIDITLAAAKVGARALYLNTDFAGPQIRDVCKREGVELLVHDEEFTELVADTEAPLGKLVAWHDGPTTDGTLEALIESGSTKPPPAPEEHAKVIMLTSGTTGTPKGAPRENPRSLAPLGALLSKIPMKAYEATYVAPPMFHALGFANLILGLSFGSTIVTRRRFDAESVVKEMAEARCTALIVVPVMLHRIVALGPEALDRHDLSALRIVFAGGAQLEADLATRTLDRFGPVLYNLYGSTEVAYASVATPEDLRAAPGCAGKPPMGTTVRILDEQGRPLPQGETGRIFVGNGFEFEGYTGGGTKEVIDGLMSSGDVGHFDEGGRLFIDGRDDEMIISGGENVFPREIEELLLTHEAIDEAAAIGVSDEVHGQRLRAFLTTRADAELTEEDVKAFVKSNLARFKVPRDVVFLEEMPRNPTGKILKRDLEQMQVGEPAAKDA